MDEKEANLIDYINVYRSQSLVKTLPAAGRYAISLQDFSFYIFPASEQYSVFYLLLFTYY